MTFNEFTAKVSAFFSNIWIKIAGAAIAVLTFVVFKKVQSDKASKEAVAKSNLKKDTESLADTVKESQATSDAIKETVTDLKENTAQGKQKEDEIENNIKTSAEAKATAAGFTKKE